MPGIHIRDVSKQFPGGVQALDSVSCEVREGEVVTIVGPSGCGKSTLLRIVAGLDEATGGTVEIGGQAMNGIPARDRNIAMVFQSYALYPHMNCFENLALNLRLKKVGPVEVAERVRATARMLEIEDLLEKKPRELSGGQRQRVAVGRALIRNPQAFLFDEPLSNLDAALRERVRHELKELFEKLAATVLYVTHDQVEAMTLADRVVILDHGRVQQIGTPEEVYRRPRNKFVASFIGSPAMNLFDTVLQDGGFPLGGERVETHLAASGEATIGVRPENIELTPSGIPASVRWIEPLGAEYLIGVDVAGTRLALAGRCRPDSGQVHVNIQPGSIHVFDKNSGANLALAGAGGSSRG